MFFSEIEIPDGYKSNSYFIDEGKLKIIWKECDTWSDIKPI